MRAIKSTMLLVGVAAALAVTVPVAEARTLRLGHNAAVGGPRDLSARLFAERVEKATGGEITVSVGPAGQFGDDLEMLTGIRLGTLDITVNSQGPLAGIVPEAAVFGLPFLFEDLETAWKVLDGPAGDALAEKVQANGMVLLGYWDNGIRQISNNVRPINAPADLAGMKIRTPSDPATIDTFEALGANPTTIKFSELYLALQQGVVDGQENPLMNIYPSKLHEVQKFISLSGHKYEMSPMLVSETVWSSLSEDEQAGVREAAIAARDHNRQLSLRADREMRGKIEATGVAFNTVDRAAFVAATEPVWAKWQEQMGDYVTEVREAAEAAEAR